MRCQLFLITTLMGLVSAQICAQEPEQNNPVPMANQSVSSPSGGWADEAVTIGYVTAPSVVTLMFVSALINDWNSRYAGIPASTMILMAPPLIYAGGRSVRISKDLMQSRAKLGWALYALSVIPTSMALYGYTTEWGPTIPVTIASGVLGAGSIVAMTAYAFSRAETARKMDAERSGSLQLGISPLAGGALATIVLRF